MTVPAYCGSAKQKYDYTVLKPHNIIHTIFFLADHLLLYRITWYATLTVYDLWRYS